MLPLSDTNHLTVLSQHGFSAVMKDRNSGEKSLTSLSSFLPNDIVSPFSASNTFKTPNYLTVQVNHQKHISLFPEFLQFINHSCDPNVFFDTTSMNLIALKAIQPGDSFCFFYPSTELDMAQPFDCLCAASNCLKKISGALFIPEETINTYRLTEFIKKEVNKKQSL